MTIQVSGEYADIQELIVIDSTGTGTNCKSSSLVYVNLIGSEIIRLARSGMSDDKIVSELSKRLNMPEDDIQKEFAALKLSLSRALAQSNRKS